MIEVIRHGKKRMYAGCSKCGCEFTYDIDDQKDGWVTCPDCHNKLDAIMAAGYDAPQTTMVDKVPVTVSVERMRAIACASKIGTLVDVRCGIVYSDYANKIRHDEYGRGFKDAIELAKGTIDKHLNELMQEAREND